MLDPSESFLLELCIYLLSTKLFLAMAPNGFLLFIFSVFGHIYSLPRSLNYTFSWFERPACLRLLNDLLPVELTLKFPLLTYLILFAFEFRIEPACKVLSVRTCSSDGRLTTWSYLRRGVSSFEFAGKMLDLLITGSFFFSVFGATLWAGNDDGTKCDSLDEEGASIWGNESPIITLYAIFGRTRFYCPWIRIGSASIFFSSSYYPLFILRSPFS